jgi:hypothetical protein
MSTRDLILQIREKIIHENNLWLKSRFSLGFYTTEYKKRIKLYRSSKVLFKAFLGIFIFNKIPKNKDLIIFQGLRNSAYFDAFDKESVFIIGSHIEKEYAKLNGYNFIWLFPIELAVNVACHRNFKFLLTYQLMRWFKIITQQKKTLFFLYEDTQPTGIFFSALTNQNRTTSAKSICIQHGIYCKTSAPRARLDGLLSNMNLLIDRDQASIIGLEKNTYEVIGLPHNALSQKRKSNIIDIIFIGPGGSSDGNISFENTIKFYKKLHSRLVFLENINIIYRPHPDELNRTEVMELTRSIFQNFDFLPVTESLRRTQAIYISTVSTMLYEAMCSGHLVVAISKIIPTLSLPYQPDHIIDPDAIDDFINWINELQTGLISWPEIPSIEAPLPIQRFHQSIKNLELI